MVFHARDLAADDPVERAAGHVAFAQADQWQGEMLVGRLAWIFYCLVRWYQIIPRIVMILMRRGVHRE